MTKFWNFQGLKNVINHNTSNLLKRSCGPHGHLSGLRTNLKLGVKSRKSFWHFKNLSWRFSTTLSTSNQKKSSFSLYFSGNEKSMDFCCWRGRKHLNINSQRDINPKYCCTRYAQTQASPILFMLKPSAVRTLLLSSKVAGSLSKSVTWYFPQMMAILVVLSIFFSVFRVWNQPSGRWIFSLMHFLAQVSGDRR